MQSLVHVSIPRSGHHYLASLLVNAFFWGEFVHCEMYDFEACCKSIPCTKQKCRAQKAFGTDENLQLFMQKNHDMENEVSCNTSLKYVAQIRNPAQATIAWLRWNKTTLPIEAIGGQAISFLIYYLKFFHKWVAGRTTDKIHIIKFEDLIADPRATVENICNWTGSKVDAGQLELAVEATNAVDAHTGAARNIAPPPYPEEFYESIFGSFYYYVLSKLERLCPDFPYRFSPPKLSELAQNQFDKLFYAVDFTKSEKICLDLSDVPSLSGLDALRKPFGILHSFGFGLSFPENGHGLWTDGDVVIIPFRCNSSTEELRFSAEWATVTGGPKFNDLEVYAVIDGKHVGKIIKKSESTARNAISASFPVQPAESRLIGEGCFVLRFENLSGRPHGENRKLGVLLRKIEVSATH